MLLVSQVKVRISVVNVDFVTILAKKLNTSKDNILDVRIDKRSIDARRKDDIFFVYNLLVKVKGEKAILTKRIPNVVKNVVKEYITDHSKIEYRQDKKIAIIGFGPAGMFSALTFAEAGVKVTVFERGEAVDERVKTIKKFNTQRILNTESNIQFGEGGAGTFSDGKLYARTKDVRGKWLFKQLVEAGAPEEIQYVHNPHIGTDKLVKVVKNIRKKIISLGSTIHFNSKVTNVLPKESGIELSVNGKKEIFDFAILAIGHSSRDTIEMLYKNSCDIVQKPFAVGFRVEHKQSMINKVQFGQSASNDVLGAAEYKLTYQSTNSRGVYTFCMCPGGLVVPAASEEGLLVVNGMSEYKRDKINSNSAVLVTVNENDFGSDHPLAGIKFQRDLEKKAFNLGGNDYNAPVQTVADYLNNKTTTKLGNVLPSYAIGVKLANLRTLFSDDINKAFIEGLTNMGRKIKGFDSADALLTGVESRSSSPVRILRNKESLESNNFRHLYPTGEGAGYAGGIVSAAIDGIKVSEKILSTIVK